MSRLSLLLKPKAPTLQGEVRQHRADEGDVVVLPDFRTMVRELRNIMGPRFLSRELGMSQSSIEHIKGNSYWDISYRRGMKVIKLYEDTMQKRAPML